MTPSDESLPALRSATRVARQRPSIERLWPARMSPARHLPVGVIPACVTAPERWFPQRPTGHSVRQAQAECTQCSLRRQCARVALDDIGHAYGIWAGVFVHSSRWSSNDLAARRAAVRELAYPSPQDR